MINPQDEQSLQRLLPNPAIPEALREQISLWTRLYHSDGHSGPLGTVALISLLTASNVPLRVPPKSSELIDWRVVAPGSRIQAHYFGDWQPGTFVRMGMYGLLEIKLDSDPVVRECRASNARLLTTDRKPDPVPAALAPAAALVPPPAVEPAPVPATVVEPEPPATQPPVIDFTAVAAGTPVWVELGDDFADGKFLEIVDDHKVLVQIDNEQGTRPVNYSQVTLAS